MTDQQRNDRINAKRRLVATLPRHTERLAAATQVRATDERITSYMNEVLTHPDKHNYFEILGVVRFLDLLERYRWNPARVRKYFRFYEVLKFSGEICRRSYRLTPVQAFQFASIFGFERPDGRRLTRNVILFVPRKFSKTTSTAALAVYDLLFGDNNAQAYVGANSYNQAKICFDEIRKIVRGIDPRERAFKVNREKITMLKGDRQSSITCLSGNAKTMDGLNASLVIMDEYSQARDTATRGGADLKNTLTSSMGTRREPLTVVITTASEVTEGAFARELDGAKRVLEGNLENDALFASIFEPDADDHEGDPATWAKVQPHLGITVQSDYYASEWADAQLSADKMQTFRTKLLNIFAVNEQSAWIDDKSIQEVQTDFELTDYPRTTPAFISIDLSEDNDFTSVSVMLFAKPQALFKTYYFFPEGALSGHPNERMYREWVEQGHLILTHGAVVDYNAVSDFVFDTAKKCKVLRLGYDNWRATELVHLLEARGAKNYTMPVRQTLGYFTAPCDAFTRGVKQKVWKIDNNPITRFCFANAVILEDNIGNRKPIKRARNLKIDGVITCLMCVRLFLDHKF